MASLHARQNVFDATDTFSRAFAWQDAATRISSQLYFIDFGLSVHFESFAARKRILGFAGLNLVPELSDDVPYDPFAVDIRQFGDLVAEINKVRSPL